LIEQFEEQNESEVKIESTELPKEMLTYYRKLKAVENMQGIQMRLPFSVTFN